MLRLSWGFYKDSWLIDPMPETFEIRVEEHPDGIRLNPSKLTLYFGANPMYLWGTGKLYHEVIFAQYGFIVVPLFLGRPGFELVSSISYSLEKERDWLDNPIGERVVGRADIDKMVKTYLNQIYGIEPLTTKTLVKPNDLSSKLVKADDSQLDKQYTVGYTPIYANTSDLTLNNDAVALIPLTLKNKSIYEVINNKELDYESPFDKIYITNGLYESVVSLKTVRVDITEQLDEMFKDEKGFNICFKLLPNFREGTLIDYGSTQNENDKNYGFRLDVNRNSITLILNNGDKFEYLTVPVTLSFITANAFFIKVEYGGTVEIRINDQVFKYRRQFKKPVFQDGIKGFLSGLSVSKQTVETGDLAEVGLFGYYVDPKFRDKYLAMEPILPYPGIPKVQDTLTPVFEDLTYSVPVKILLPQGTGSKKSTKPHKSYGDMYLANDNSQVQKNEIDSFNRSSNYVETFIPVGWNVFRTLGRPDPNFDNKTDFIFMLKKLTSDIHIPLKIDIHFRLPEWWTKDMQLHMKLKMVPIGKSMWYPYEKYRTGEWK